MVLFASIECFIELEGVLMQANIPSEQEVLSYFDSLCNWGKWGDEDQLGCPNYIDQAKTLSAIQMVKEGTTVSLARTVVFEASLDAPNPPVHFMVESGAVSYTHLTLPTICSV